MSSEEEALVAFLTARLDEKAATASYCGPALVAWLSVRDDGGRFLYTTVAATSGEVDDVWCADGKVLPEPASVRVVYDPARELSDVEAKRAIVGHCVKALRYPANVPLASLARRVLADLGAIWSDHPDYRKEEWRP